MARTDAAAHSNRNSSVLIIFTCSGERFAYRVYSFAISNQTEPSDMVASSEPNMKVRPFSSKHIHDAQQHVFGDFSSLASNKMRISNGLFMSLNLFIFTFRASLDRFNARIRVCARANKCLASCTAVREYLTLQIGGITV